MRRMETQIHVDRHIANDDMFIIRGGITTYEDYWDSRGKYEEYIRISNQINLNQLTVNMSTCFPSDFELAEKMSDCYSRAFKRAREEFVLVQARKDD